MRVHLFDARMLRPLVGYLERHGVKSEKYLDQERISGETVNTGGWITKKQAYDLVYAVVDQEHCPEAIFSAYNDFRLDDLGPIAVAMSSCRTVKEVLEITTLLGNAAYEGNEYFLDIDGETTWLSYREPKTVSAGQEMINDMTLAVYRCLICAIVDPTWRPFQARTQGVSAHRHLGISNFEDCHVTSHAKSTGIAFPTEFLSRRVNLESSGFDRNRCQTWEIGPEDEDDFVNALHRLLVSRFKSSSFPTLQEITRLTGLSPATIKRHLRTSGFTYQTMLDRIRFDAADQMLTQSQLSVKEIASELGYSGTNNFVRAFRRFAAMTPTVYREKCFNK